MKVITSMVSREITKKLTDAEMADDLRKLRDINSDIAKTAFELEELKDKYKSRIADLAARRDQLIERGKGEICETIQCKMTKDFKNREIRYAFEGKVIERRPMTEAEAQMEMKLKAKGSKRQKLANGQDKEIDSDVKSVIASETNRKTKTSAVDGALQ